MPIIKFPLIRYIFILLNVVLLNGCTSIIKTKSPVVNVNLTLVENGKLLPINYTLTLPPDHLVGTVTTQLIEANFANKNQQFIAQIEYSKDQIAIVGVSTTGIPLFEVVWRNDAPILLNKYVPLPELKVEFIIADIQWTHWSMEQLKSSVVGDNISIVEKDFPETLDDTGLILRQRQLLQNNQVILEVNKFENYFQLEHKLRNYSIKITPLNKDKK